MNRTFYLNGKFVPEEKAVIPVTAHALHYGTGCFEGIRAYYNEDEKALFVFRLEDHFRRMVHSTKILFIKLPGTPKELAKITVELLQKNYSETDIYIRPLAFKQDPAVGNFNLTTLADGFCIYTVPLGRYLKEKGVRANVSSWMRIPDRAIPPRGKVTGAYVNTAFAKTESLLGGFDEALFMDENGHIVEGSAENLFMVRDGKLITPAMSDDILIGLTRDTIIKIAKDELGIETIERSIDRSDIYLADEVFVCGTGAEVTPVIEIDHRKIGDGGIGEITGKIRKLYFDIVHGKNPKYSNWLTKVENRE